MKRIFTLLFLTVTFTLSAQEPIDTDGNGYRNISTLEQLRWISENDSSWSWNFELDNDIDASDTRNWNIGDHDDNPETPDSAMGWSPIHTSKYNRKFTINGNGNTINGLFCNRPNFEYVGFLGNVSTINVENIRLTNVEIKGNGHTGILAGYASNGIVRNCFTSGIVKGLGEFTGGIVGLTGSVILLNSYSKSVVKGSEKTGGLIGNAFEVRMINNYFAGQIITESESKEPLVCFDKSTDGIYNCFWDINTTNIDSSNFGIPKTTKELKTRATYENASWDLNFNWDMDSSYPYLRKEIPYEPQDIDKDGFYEISNLRDFRYFSESDYSLTYSWELMNDLDADSTKYWNGGKGYKPKGSTFLPFNEIFSGNGFQIQNLHINRPQENNIGLFGFSNPTIIDLGIENCNIIGNTNVGSIVGNSDNAGFDNNTYASGIYRCYSNGNVEGNSYTGGFVGRNTLFIYDSYCIINVKGNLKKTSGFVSYNKGAIINCYSASNLNGEDLWGFVAEGTTGPSAYCYWDKDISNTQQSRIGTPLNTLKIKNDSIFKHTGYNFYSIWAIDPEINEGYPFINIQNRTIPIPEPIEPLDPDGNGYRNVKSIENLLWISYSPDSFNLKYELLNDINAAQTFKWENYNGFTPIGTQSLFEGEFNGNNFVIDSIFINPFPNIHLQYIGLFSRTTGFKGKIYNLGVTNCNIRGKGVGGIIGYNTSRISGCYTSGIIIGGIAGGIAGYHFRNIMDYCYTTASIFGSSIAGGIAAKLNVSNISKCYSNGYVVGLGANGGIVGMTDDYLNDISISNCYSRSKVYGGGILGANRIAIKNCYAAGEIIGDRNVGGLVADENNPENSFWDIESSQIDFSAGGTGKSTAEMKTKSTFTDAGWDFDDIWFISEDVNDGYPALFGMDNPVTSVGDKINDENRIAISPNPASDYIEISFGSGSNGAYPIVSSEEIAIYNMLGEKVVHSSTSVPSGHLRRRRTIRMNVANLPKGVYFVRVGERVEKFVKY